jgi:hypothetical protein
MGTSGEDTKKVISGGKTIMPEPLSINLSACTLTIKTNCGGCRHFNRMAYPEYGIVCEKKGILETAKPCVRFSPDPRQIKFKNDADLVALAKALANVSKNKLPLLASLINKESRTRKQGWCFGEICYIRIFGEDYISNYRRSRIISADSQYVTIEGKGGFTASLTKSSVLNARQWKKKKRELEAAGKITDPNYSKYIRLPTKAEREAAKILDGVNPPALDGVTAKGRKAILSSEQAVKAKRVIKVKKPVFSTKRPDLRTTSLDQIFKTRS